MDYDSKILRKLQLTQLDILKDIDSFCKENDIKYFISYGTLLGAVRHGGFIPWDDDIDICMMREDYNKFIELAKEKMKDKYDVLNIYDTEGYMVFFAKLSKKGTVFTEASNTSKTYKQGIFIDIFPMDYVTGDKEVRKKIFRKAWTLARLAILSETGKPVLQDHMSNVKKAIVLFGCRTIHLVLNLIRLNKVKVYKKYLKVAESSIEKEYVSMYSALKPETGTFKYSDIYPTKLIKFEDCEFEAPANTDIYLKSIYNDYMQLPPEDRRHNHMASELIFGDEE